MIQRSFVIDPKYVLKLQLTNIFPKKKPNNFRPKRVKIGNNLIKNTTSWWTKSCWKAEWKAKSWKTRREYHNLVLSGHAVKRGKCKLLCLYSKVFRQLWYCGWRDQLSHIRSIVRVPFYVKLEQLDTKQLNYILPKKCSHMSIIRN